MVSSTVEVLAFLLDLKGGLNAHQIGTLALPYLKKGHQEQSKEVDDPLSTHCYQINMAHVYGRLGEVTLAATLG